MHALVTLIYSMGYAGSLEAAFSILAIRDGVVPHTLNLATLDPAFGFTMVKDAPVSPSELLCIC